MGQQAVGKAVISNVGIGSEFVDRVEVLKTYTEDPGELADRILELLNNDDLRFKMGRNARKKAEKLFNLRNNAHRLFGIYKKTLSGRS